MKAIDTNILVRFIIADESTDTERMQYAQAMRIMRENTVFILNSVFLEAVWVLGRLYKIPREKYLFDLNAIASFKNVVLENPQRIALALHWHSAGMDFADALHLAGATENDHNQLLTFDVDFVKKAKDKSGCRVSVPS